MNCAGLDKGVPFDVKGSSLVKEGDLVKERGVLWWRRVGIGRYWRRFCYWNRRSKTYFQKDLSDSSRWRTVLTMHQKCGKALRWGGGGVSALWWNWNCGEIIVETDCTTMHGKHAIIAQSSTDLISREAREGGERIPECMEDNSTVWRSKTKFVASTLLIEIVTRLAPE